ncbi:hypothetical protein WG954_16375 [Lacibacter sp. H375]|uniref:hypothetical protein n=1 Tax=Lacibacter sp. H375 TaxID=3133424 RepID=UPI0030BCAD08
MDKTVYNKLTESARVALDETSNEVVEMILERAYQNASQKNTADKEISLRDIIEAKEEILYKKADLNKQESRKRRMVLTLSMAGALYSMLGILFYLYQNKQFDTTKDVGLLIAALGILVSIASYFYSQLAFKRKVELIKDNTVVEKDNSEFEIVRRWQTIEKLGTELMLKDGISDNKARSFNYIHNYLSEKLLDNLKSDSLKRLLLIRNQIVHSSTNLTREEIEEMIKIADQIIDELEKQIQKHSE